MSEKLEKNKTKKKPKHELKSKHAIESKHVKIQKNKLAVTKKENTEISKFTKQLEIIQKEIKEETSLPKDKADKLDMCIFKNTIFAIICLVYFITINVLSVYLEPIKLLSMLKISSVATIILTIVVFECAYRKDSDKIALYGIELLVISIAILFARYIYLMINNKYVPFVISLGLVFSVYYIGKAIVEFILQRKKMKREIIHNNNDEMRSK